MGISSHAANSSRSRQRMGPLRSLLHLAALVGSLLATPVASPQTLARPGWAGSGMTVERWWPHAVFCELRPDSLLESDMASSKPTLDRLAAQLEDLQTLGVDAVLLRGLEPGPQPGPPTQNASPTAAMELDPRYGTLEDFDRLLAEAVRHGIRVLVELRPGASGPALIADARFWLNRGVTGLALPSNEEPQTRALRGLLHSYIGERVLIAESTPPSSDAKQSDGRLLTEARSPRTPGRPRISAAARADQPDLLLVRLPPPAQGPAVMRNALERARATTASGGSIPLLSAPDEAADSNSARPLAAALLGSGGAVLLSADSINLRDATFISPQSLFAWYRQCAGLHRGNPVMRTGADTLLDHDADGALVWVRSANPGTTAVVAVCNLTDHPLQLSLVEDLARLHLRGSFLRTLARSDNGMGAMPLRSVSLPPFGVYVGELSR